LRFKVFVLAPVSFVLLAIAANSRAFRGEEIWRIEFETILTAASVQLGYLSGSVGQMIDEKPRPRSADDSHTLIRPHECEIPETDNGRRLRS
jgi:hypothetical protein